MHAVNRTMSILLATSLAWLVTGCDAPAPRSVARPPTRDQIPSAVSVAGGTFEFGFAFGRLRTMVSTPVFSITKTPVTVAQYRECVAANACSAQSVTTGPCASATSRDIEGATYSADASMDNLPLTCAHPQQAGAYCNWVGGALPTIEEWQFAARGATVQRFSWGNDAPDCNKHPRALPVDGEHEGCCSSSSCEPLTFYGVGQRPDVVSPGGLLDVLLTPAELVRGTAGSSVPACDNPQGACAVQGNLPGAIDFVMNISDDVERPARAEIATVYGFRCAFEVKP